MKFLEHKIPPPLLMLLSLCGMWFIASLDKQRVLQFEFAIIVAIVFALLGFTCAIIGVLHFKDAMTTINPLVPESASSLVTNGIYQTTRNPMCLGMLFVLVGVVIYLGSVFA